MGLFSFSNPEKQLNELLAKGGFTSSNPDPAVAWGIFKQFVVKKFKCHQDDLLFQCGIYNFTGEQLFYWDLVRQFSYTKNGEYDRMEQLHIEFVFKPLSKFVDVEKSVWSSDFDSIEKLFYRS